MIWDQAGSNRMLNQITLFWPYQAKAALCITAGVRGPPDNSSRIQVHQWWRAGQGGQDVDVKCWDNEPSF